MPEFYKVAVRGISVAQEIANILYYMPTVNTTAPFDATLMGELATAVETMWTTNLAPVQLDSWEVNEIGITIVNELNQTTSPYELRFSVNIPGQRIQSGASTGLAAIIGFRVGPLVPDQAQPTPKRSYLAFGPIGEDDVTDSGALAWSQAEQDAVVAGLTSELTTASDVFVPVRVGRGRADGQASYGRVDSAVVRPYATFRRSRMISTTGR